MMQTFEMSAFEDFLAHCPCNGEVKFHLYPATQGTLPMYEYSRFTKKLLHDIL